MRLGFCTLVVALAAVPAFAQAPVPVPPAAAAPIKPADPVVARVNGEEVRLSDITSAAQNLPQQYRTMPSNVLFPLLVDQSVDRLSLVALARKQGLDKDPDVQRAVAHAVEQTLQNAVIAHQVGPQVTEAAIRARYDSDIAGKKGEEEVHARHILVPTEAQAQKIIADLAKGADFATLAKANSTDPGAAQGGDLGFFKRGDMLPEFAAAAFALKPGQITQKPVKTQYGWHVIKVEERRNAPAPTFEESHDELRQTMIQEDVQKLLTQARTGVTIERYNPDGTPVRPTDSAEPPPAPAAGRRQEIAMALPVSPLAVPFPALAPMAGVRFGAVAAGIRYQGRPDLMMAEFASGTTVAGVFTSSRCPGAPVDWCRAALAGGRARALVVNAGNANVFTGRAGTEATKATAAAAARLVGCPPRQVFLASTGVIGETLPHQRITAALPGLHAGLAEDGWQDAARGIMTTDTFPKGAMATAELGGVQVSIAGFAKGSGMIAPDMATMLCFIVTDAKLPAAAMQRLLGRGVAASFNCTTVDSDTSTSDTVLLFATGQAKHARVPAEGGRMLNDFGRALNRVLLDLALQVVRDGEGAQKLIRVDVAGAVSAKSAKRIAMAVANSPLVKTAVAGEDANWGRIAMAIGKAGEPADRDRIAIGIGGTWMARDGSVVPGYDEAPVVAHMKGREIGIAIDLALGRGRATTWTCDLTHGYIDINGSYRS